MGLSHSSPSLWDSASSSSSCPSILPANRCAPQGLFYFENVMELAAAHGFDVKHGVLCKPNPRVYTLIAEQMGVSMSEVIFFDDSARNLASAHSLGALTVLVGSDTPCLGADLAIPTMHQLPAVLPELMDQPGLVHEHHSHLAAPPVGVPMAVAAAGAGGSSSSGIAITVPAA
jgi:pyrimidine and pyridine-specific 5'-nucleotidase